MALYKRGLLLLCLLLGLAAAVWTFRPVQASAGLVLYAAVGYAPAVAAKFTRQTGIPVTVINMSTGPLLARVSAEGHRPAWSLVWFDGDAAAAALDRAGLLARHSVPALPWTPVGHAVLPADGAYTPTGVTLAGVFSVPVNTKLPPGPICWDMLLQKSEAGRFGMGNPQFSGPVYLLLASLRAQHGGWLQGQDYLRRLQHNHRHCRRAKLGGIHAGRPQRGLSGGNPQAGDGPAERDGHRRRRKPGPADGGGGIHPLRHVAGHAGPAHALKRLRWPLLAGHHRRPHAPQPAAAQRDTNHGARPGPLGRARSRHSRVVRPVAAAMSSTRTRLGRPQMARCAARLGFGLPTLLLFLLLFVYPLLRFLLLPIFPALGPLGAQGLTASGSALSARAVLNTLELGVITAGIATPLGIACGFLLECRHRPGNRLLSLCLWLVFVMPSYLLATGGQILFGWPALQNSLASHWFFSAPGIVALLTLKALPFACLLACGGWRAIGGELGDAARIHVHDTWSRRAILLRLLLPSAGAAFVIVFVEVIQDFGIAATLGAQIHMPLIIYAIYVRLTTMPIDFSAAAGLSWYLVLFAGLAVALHVYLSLRYTAALVHGRQREAAKHACTPAEAIAAGLGLGALGLSGILMRLGVLLAEALAPASDAFLPAGAWTSLVNSAAYGITAGLLALLFAAPLAARAGRSQLLRQALDVITLGNMAVPGLVLGAAYIIAFNQAWLPLYGTPLLLVTGYVATQAPMLVRFLQPALSQLHVSLADAGRIHGLRFARRLRDLHVPLLARPLLWGWSLAFGQIVFELPVSELLYPAGRTPLGVQLLQFDQNLNFVAEARLAFCGIALCLAMVAIAALLASGTQAPRRRAPSGSPALQESA
jgi:iron(III) transport system permease protein